MFHLRGLWAPIYNTIRPRSSAIVAEIPGGFRPHGLLPSSPSLPLFQSLFLFLFLHLRMRFPCLLSLFARICSPSPYKFFFFAFLCTMLLPLPLLLLVEGGECLLRFLLFGRAAVSYSFIFTFQSALLFPSSSFVSIPYSSPLPPWIARLTLHEAKEQSNFFGAHGCYEVINVCAKSMEAESKHANIAPFFPSNISN